VAAVSTAAVQMRSARDLRIGAGALVGAAAIWPVLPLHPPLACPLRATTGIPCPLCGMTRACVAAVHGHLGTSLVFNPAGILVMLFALTALIRPEWLLRMRPPLWLIGGALAALWFWNIGFNPTFHQFLLR
jgi:uncharacterized protein DUF2752